MDRGFWAKRWLHITQRWPSGSVGPELFLSLFQEKVKVGFWPSVAKWSKGSCFISTKVNPRHSQTTKWSITDNFSINQNHQGPFQRLLIKFEKIRFLTDFHSTQWGGRWDGGDWPTLPNCFETKFPEILHGQRVLSQKMASYNPKMAEWFRGARSVPIIISGKSKSWVLAVGGKTVKGKVLHINQSQPQALPNYQMKHYRSLFNWPKPSGALPKVSEEHLKKSKKIKIPNTYRGRHPVWYVYQT